MDCQPQLHLAAYHSQPGYRSDTYGLGLLCALDADFSLAAGHYSNSIGRPSNYGAVAWQPWVVGGARLGGFAGIVSGYRRDPIPIGAAVVTIPAIFHTQAHVHVTMIPHVDGYVPDTLEISFSFGF
ncbi:hypothetical protein KIK84_10525 [Curvibacter sp. CHRR-16]|uniref:hypothetical protein n=1 Tax=Curvibacter sp. CHRR-16 TaxID=2835872 RepID=UPI001BDB4129|nr:hypothetical protein [Curvibacter sp. CHRR-16]MBT0570764.1 hypothetical protein [Curvibacter sp. CHRR-16]